MFKITDREKRKWAIRNSRVMKWLGSMQMSVTSAWWRVRHKTPEGRVEKHKEERRLN